MVRSVPTRSTRGRTARFQPQMTCENPREDQLPEVYQEMLEEAEARDPSQFSDRPVKRRRVGGAKAIPVDSPKAETTSEGKIPDGNSSLQVQTVYNSATEDDSDDESDVEWEDVDLQQPHREAEPPRGIPFSEGRDDTLQINFDQAEPRKKTVQRRKPVTTAEKKVRLDVHKVHLLCLLAHVQLRNRWCNDEELQKSLKTMLPKGIVALLHPNEARDQYARSTTFVDGLNQAGDIFSRKFHVNKPGIKRAHWSEDQDKLRQRVESIMSDAEVFLSKEDFRSNAKTVQGSRDFGAQLFCALLRSVAVDARLVCSLQPLPFSGTVKDMTPSKNAPQSMATSPKGHKSPAKSPTPTRARRIGRPEFLSRPAKPAVRLGMFGNPEALQFGQNGELTNQDSRPILRESSYPVFWVEAFNEAMQKWVVIDPLVTKSIGKPSKFEPPASDLYNSMNYVVAFEEDTSARDVTRRYAKAFNAKTRKSRIESTRDGEKWWDKALSTYEKVLPDDRDEMEIGELTSKTAAEPMPRNIQDFKDHPVYALERHLKRNQVIFPKRAIGNVGLSKTTAKSDNLETVYRRSDVHVVRSANKWYRLGRDVKVGEQPLKHVTANRPKSGFTSDEEAEADETALYAEYQTEVYIAPPVVQGRIPKNAFGNLDLYVPSMVPPGAVHVQRPYAARAARILGIDYADAVTGFDFKGRRGTAVFGGIVIALEYQEALQEVLKGMAEERQQALLEARSAQALQFWRLFVVKLRIAERVKGYAGADEENDDASASEMSVDQAEEFGGGFIPESDEPEHSPPRETEKKKTPFEPTFDGAIASSNAGAFDHEDDGFAGGFIPDQPADGSPAQEAAIAPLPLANNDKKTKASIVPRYELVVIPSNPIYIDSSTTPERGLPTELEGSSEKAPITVDSSTNGGSKSTSVDIASRPVSPHASHPVQAPQDSDSEIEKGSLLSEDPEDEDAIPEWLV